VVVQGNGRAFTGGGALAAFTGGGGPVPADTAAGRLMAEAITGMQAVTVAAIHGHCVGGGLVLAAACDLRVAAEDVRFVIPEVDLGIPLAWGGIPRLVREVGPAATRDLVMTCRPFGAAEAQALGFVNRVVPMSELEDAADGLARLLASKSAYTLRATLRAVDAAAEALVPTGGAWNDADSLAAARRDPESRELARRYLESLGR
ncbi:MAG: enoyl-CoA hydratase/isomerase family protein, partial [Acidimicrobiaceae bacterium]|nr:enoyl-CoA hydratase/isomerase family protein [Acidimicrobiaceae bacterium]